MDSFWLLLLLVVLSVVIDKADNRKKKVPKAPPRPRMKSAPPSGKEPLGFEVPPLRGAPQPESVQGADGAWHEPGTQLEEQLQAVREAELVRQRTLARERERAERERAIRAAEEAAYAAQAQLPGREARPALQLTPQQALTAIAWAEILGRPKAYRGRVLRY